jgi:PIN domain nuclease of toxin-antitoxin system
VKLLFDTHLLLWAATAPEMLPPKALGMLEDESVTPLYSAASIWEVAIKARLGREDFRIDPRVWRTGLNENGYDELSIDSGHALLAGALPLIHSDPFDRMLVAQAKAEGVTLVTVDAQIAKYDGPIELVG